MFCFQVCTMMETGLLVRDISTSHSSTTPGNPSPLQVRYILGLHFHLDTLPFQSLSRKRYFGFEVLRKINLGAGVS